MVGTPMGPAGTGGTDTMAGTGGSAMPPTMTGSGGAATMPPPMTGTGGSMGAAGMTMPPVTTGGPQPVIPMVSDPCPTLATGMITVKGQQVQLWVGARREDVAGAVLFYWHGTGGRSTEAVNGLGAALEEITSEGGLVASFTTTTRTGMNTGNNVWYTGDFEMADVILACAVQQLNIDTRRVYTGGCSAGGLQAGAMVYGRSSYLAGAMPNSGGVVFPGQLQDPAHVPALITTHGAMGRDVVIIDFSTTSLSQCRDVAGKGGFAVDCDHGGGHCASPAAVKAAQWEFLKAHPFGVEPQPYAGGLPASFPDYCTIVM
jgi:predicted esterase